MSTIKVDNIRIASESVSRPATGVAAAWVNFNGTTVTAPNDMAGVRDSLNVSGIIDQSTGSYIITRTNAMANADYTSSGMVKNSTGSFQVISSAFGGVYSTTQSQYSVSAQTNQTSAAADSSDVFVVNHGDLA